MQLFFQTQTILKTDNPVEDVTYSTSIEWTPATQHNTSGYVHKQRIGQVEL
jgi:hypothetical protein